MKCLIERECVFCNKVFNNLALHISKKHKDITLKEYYDTYIEPNTFHKCGNPNCNNETAFTYFSYRIYCCRKCATNDIKTINKNYETFLKNHQNLKEDYKKIYNKKV